MSLRLVVGQNVIDAFEKTVKAFDARSDVAVAVVSTKLVEDARASIIDQTIRVKPLSLYWEYEKARLKLDPRILIATGEYVKSFYSARQSQGKWIASASWDKYTWHEFGTRTVPARPHWLPATVRAEKTAPEDFSKIVLQDIFR